MRKLLLLVSRFAAFNADEMNRQYVKLYDFLHSPCRIMRAFPPCLNYRNCSLLAHIRSDTLHTRTRSASCLVCLQRSWLDVCISRTQQTRGFGLGETHGPSWFISNLPRIHRAYDQISCPIWLPQEVNWGTTLVCSRATPANRYLTYAYTYAGR